MYIVFIVFQSIVFINYCFYKRRLRSNFAFMLLLQLNILVILIGDKTTELKKLKNIEKRAIKKPFFTEFETPKHMARGPSKKPRPTNKPPLEEQENIEKRTTEKPQSSSEKTCDIVWQSNSSQKWCIKVVYDRKLTWYKAKDFCALQNKYLVEILDYTKDKLIQATFRQVQLENPLYFEGTIALVWIGFRYNRSNIDLWLWDRSNVEVSFFRNNAPTIVEKDRCGQLYIPPRGSNRWLSEHCSRHRMFICECEAGENGYCTTNTHDLESPDTCDPPCKKTKCDPSIESCKDTCDAGFYGPKCDLVCTDNTYGPGCLEECSPHCGGIDNECHPSNGSCLETCETGFNGTKCDKICTNHTYGPGCTEKCSPHCGGTNKECNPFNGSCEEFCEAGFHGPKCDLQYHKLGYKSPEEKIMRLVLALSTIFLVTLCVLCLAFVGSTPYDDFGVARERESKTTWEQDFEYESHISESGSELEPDDTTPEFVIGDWSSATLGESEYESHSDF